MKEYFPKLTGHDNANCSTIIVGKNAAKSGKVILAHNEDDMNSVVQLHRVPRMEHKEGEVLIFDDGDAVIPQVSETYSYYWSEVRSPSGESFADGFVNEWGVAVVSNSCVGSKKTDAEPPQAGVGYALRRIIAERSKTAREGVEVAAALIAEFGYISARSYAICDKDEGWVFQVTTGHNYVAQKVGDDEVFYIPNWYNIHSVDFSDTAHKNFYFSSDLVQYPLRHGWYKPAKEGDFSDFDFSEAYQEGGIVPSNILRSDLAWRFLYGKDGIANRTFSIKAPRKYDIADMKALLRTHYDGYEKDLESQSETSPHRYGICRDTTVESLVMEFNDDADLTCLWRACPRPCATPFAPWYVGATRMPDGYEWSNVTASQRSHLSPDPSEFKYNPNSAYWPSHILQNLMEFNYAACAPTVHGSIAKLEANWTAAKPIIDRAYLDLKAVCPEYAKEFLTDYNCAQGKKVWDWANQTILDLTNEQNKRSMDAWRSKL
ncbi:MAG: C69 family dipeptidase [Oscillospiraceae bacterium]